MLRQVIKRSSSTISSTASSQSRAFHSPFAVLAAKSSSTTSSPVTPKKPIPKITPYEKQLDASPDPFMNPTGTRTYVVSSPDPTNTPYEVPTGAYPNATPYSSPLKPEAVRLNGMSHHLYSISLAILLIYIYKFNFWYDVVVKHNSERQGPYS